MHPTLYESLKHFCFYMNNCKMLIKVQTATTMCMYVAHWNIFMVNKRDLQQNKKMMLRHCLGVLKRLIKFHVWGTIGGINVLINHLESEYFKR